MYFSLIIIMTTMTSCSNDNDIDVIEDDQKNEVYFHNAAMTIQPQISKGNIFAPIVSEYHCSSNKYRYSIYASGKLNYNHDRIVHVAVLKNGGFIDAKILTIPAGSSTSENQFIFSHGPTEEYGLVVSRAFHVYENGIDETGFYEFPPLTKGIQNCYYPTGSNPCTQGIFPPDDPNTSANEGAGDEDGDGECNTTDVDDDGNGIPDAWEDWNN